MSEEAEIKIIIKDEGSFMLSEQYTPTTEQQIMLDGPHRETCAIILRRAIESTKRKLAGLEHIERVVLHMEVGSPAEEIMWEILTNPVPVKRDPFSGQPIVPSDLRLRTPQARVLAALVPDDPAAPLIDWPLVTRTQLGVRAGYTATSGTITRVLNGIRAGSSSGDPHPGLLARGMVVEIVLDVEGASEMNYRATGLGVKAYHEYVAERGGMPVVKDAAICTNDRYRAST